MIIDDFDFGWSIVGPPETDPIPFVNSDAVLPFSVPCERLKTVAWGNPEFVQSFHRVQLV
jgi:hypothetical protein